MSTTHTHPLRLLGFRDVQRLVSLSRTQIYALIRAGRFPAPVKVGEHRSAWVEAEVEAWIDERIRERDRERRL